MKKISTILSDQKLTAYGNSYPILNIQSVVAKSGRGGHPAYNIITCTKFLLSFDTFYNSMEYIDTVVFQTHMQDIEISELTTPELETIVKHNAIKLAEQKEENITTFIQDLERTIGNLQCVIVSQSGALLQDLQSIKTEVLDDETDFLSTLSESSLTTSLNDNLTKYNIYKKILAKAKFQLTIEKE